MNGSKPLLKVDMLKTWIRSEAGPIRAVDGISFEIGANETFALLGESGCGKSITALSVMRLLPEAAEIHSGSIQLQGGELLALPETEMRGVRGKRVSMIFQEPQVSLNPVMSVGDQILETLERHTSLRGSEARKRVLDLLQAVGIPDIQRRFGEYPFQMSGGMKQRVMIAMALACEPSLLIADEPTTALDVTMQAQVLELMRRLQEERGMSILLITHDLGVVAEMAHRVAVMYAGEIVEMAPREAFFRAAFHPYSRKLFASLPGRGKRGSHLEVIRGSVPPLNTELRGCRFASRCDHAWDLCKQEAPQPIRIGEGHLVRCHLAADSSSSVVRFAEHVKAGAPDESRAGSPGELLLDVRDLQVHFPIRSGLLKRVVAQVKAVDGVSLQIHRHRTLALVGESGCGKTTVGKGILQLIRPTAGSVRYDGTELTSLSSTDMRRQRADMQIVFQDPYASLDPRMMIADIIEEGMVALGVGRSKTERHQHMDRILEQVGLSSQVKVRYPHEFSGGQRQRIAIARAMAVNPKLIVCDEPTSALDVSVQAQILNLLKALQDELGLAYLFITHNLTVVEYLAHEVAVMYLGRVVEQGEVERIMASPSHPYTQALLSAVPEIEQEGKREIVHLQGELPSPVNPPSGCHFHPRCPQAMAVCRETYPGTTRLGADHTVRCHLYGSK